MKTDSTLKQDILDELDWEPSVDATHIGVIVRDGIVTLTGTVTTYAEKNAAENAVKRVLGVRAVVMEVEVKLPGSVKQTDQDIARAAVNNLRWNTSVPDDRIHVRVEEGWVTLDGTVDWNYQKEAAKNAVQNLGGVRGVTNVVQVKAAIEPQNVKEKIRRALERSANIDADSIAVKVEGHKVILSGSVQSWAEKRQAKEAAWSAPGVTEVQDNIEIKVREFA